MSKRARRSEPVSSFRAPRRPIDKELKVVNSQVTNSVVTTTLKTTTFPCTVVGLRWDVMFTNDNAAEAEAGWAVVVVQDGDSANTPALSDGADFYTPEQNVLAFGAMALDADGAGQENTMHFSGSTKTMRKLKQGDVLQFITMGNVAASITYFGIVQFFCKS